MQDTSDDINNTNIQEPKPISSKTKESNTKPRLIKYLTIVILVILIMVSGTFIALYWQEKNSNTNSSGDVNNNQTIIPPTEENNVNSNTTYIAKVGKFQLDLTDTYAIIVKIDGPFEGGPATQLQVGQNASGSSNVINVPALGEITLTAIPATNYENNFEAFLASAFEEQLSTPIETDATFDGVKADAYRVDGLATTEIYVFENQGIYYQVSFDSPEQEDFNQLKNDIINGFTFVE